MGVESNFIRREMEWMKDRRYFMGLEANRPVCSDEVYDDFTKHKWEDGFTLEERIKIQYAGEVLIPFAFRGEIPVAEIGIVRNRLIEFCEILNQHDLLKEEKIAA